MKELLKKYKEAILYLVFGVATTAVNLGVYYVATAFLAIPESASNVIAWFGSVIFAFITNKLFVFESKSWAWKTALKETVSFFGSRILSLVIDVALFELLIRIGLNQTLFGSPGFLAKIIVNVVVIIVNYVLSKLIVFRKQK